MNYSYPRYFIVIIFFLTSLLLSSAVLAAEIKLAWDAPTKNVDGSDLTDLAGYMIYYGKSSGQYENSLDMGNVTTYPLEGLTEGQTYFIVATAYDTSDNESEDSNEVCYPPPTITRVSASPSVLWPPNHKMVDVTVNYRVADHCGGTTCTLNVTSNEPIKGSGDGDVAPDWEITYKVRLRAERAERGAGRIYTITIRCADAYGNSSTKTVAITVPHDQNKDKQ